MNNLHLERRLVLDSSTGPTFTSGSAALSGNAKREIDQFLGDLEGSPGSGSAASERVFMVAGYTDSVGHEDYNYELGQRRATPSPDIWSAKRASTRRRFGWFPTARASRLPTTAHRAVGVGIGGSKFSFSRKGSRQGADSSSNSDSLRPPNELQSFIGSVRRDSISRRIYGDGPRVGAIR